MKILVTGGTGYIGSHTVLSLQEAGHEVVVIDNLVNSSEESLRRVAELTGKKTAFHRVDLLDEAAVDRIFTQHTIDAVIQFAGLKAVGESVREPLKYYHNNLVGTLNLIRVMDRHDVRSIVFSSSATVYGEHNPVPYVEKMEIGANNPYGRTKEQIEDILADIGAADDRWHIALLRYFNPVGAHPSGRIGEDPQGIPNNLVPFIAQVAVGRRDKLMVFGGDYDTPDGTCLRDYIHVVDLADGHVAALNHIAERTGVFRWNLGSGKGSSVLEVIRSFEKAVGAPIPYEITARRAGDLPAFWADATSALADLSWSTTKTVDQMCEDHWRWQKNNPNGYDGRTEALPGNPANPANPVAGTALEARSGQSVTAKGIRDVAAAAGVSTATVSRALRGLPHVSYATRQRIVDAAANLGYVASAAASELARGRGAQRDTFRGQLERVEMTASDNAGAALAGS